MVNYRVKIRDHKFNLRTKSYSKWRSPQAYLIGQPIISVAHPSISVHDSRPRFIQVLFTRIMRRQVTSHGPVIDTISWPVRCIEVERDIPPSFGLIANVQFLTSILFFPSTSMLLGDDQNPVELSQRQLKCLNNDNKRFVKCTNSLPLGLWYFMSFLRSSPFSSLILYFSEGLSLPFKMPRDLISSCLWFSPNNLLKPGNN